MQNFRLFITQSLFLGGLCGLALFYPEFSSVVLSIAIVCMLILSPKESESRSVLLIFKLLTIVLCSVYSVGVSLGFTSSPPVFSLFSTLKLQRFFTLPSWFFVVLFLLYIFPGQKGLRSLAQAMYSEVFFRKKVLTLCVFVVLLSQGIIVGSQVVEQGTWTIHHIQTLKDERYAVKKFGVGEALWFYRVGQFWDREISDKAHAVLGIPPQGEPWIQSSNPSYVSSFVFPAKTYSLSTHFETIPSEITHIVIVRGETDQGDFGWPKASISRDTIARLVLFNPFTGERQDKTGSDYLPKEFEGMYGLITLKQ